MIWFVMMSMLVLGCVATYVAWNVRVLKHGLPDICRRLYADRTLCRSVRRATAMVVEAIEAEPFCEDAAHAALRAANSDAFAFEISPTQERMTQQFAMLSASMVAQTVGASVASMLVALVAAAVCGVLAGIVGALAGTITGAIHGDVIWYAGTFGNAASIGGGVLAFVIAGIACFTAVILRVLDGRPMLKIGRWSATALAPALRLCLYGYSHCDDDVVEKARGEKEYLLQAVNALQATLDTIEDSRETVRMLRPGVTPFRGALKLHRVIEETQVNPSAQPTERLNICA